MSKKSTYEELEQRIQELEETESARKGAEKELRESEEKFRNIAEISLAGVYIILAGIFIYVNKRFAEIFGYSVEECLNNMHIRQTVHPEDLDLVREQISKRISGKVSSVNYTFRGITKSGKTIHVEIFGSTIPLAGKPAVAGSVLEITERKQAEEALRESEERYRALFERSLELVYLFDFEGNFIDANNVALELLGYTKDKIKSLNFGSLLTDDQLPLAVEAMEEILKTGSQKEVAEYKLRRKNGEYVYVESTGAIIYRDGKPFAIQGIARDITERKQAEKALLESEKKFSTLFQTSPVYMAFTALDDGCFLNVNDAFTTITGFQRNEVLGRTSVEIGLWFDPEERSKFIKLAQQHGGFHEKEVRFRKKNGEILFGIWSAEKVKLGDVPSLISVLVDITERKKTQEALRKERDKLRIAISEIKTLSGLVPICSHCKNIRDDQGYWNRIEKYIGERSDAQFSHGICPECAKKFYRDIDLYPEKK